MATRDITDAQAVEAAAAYWADYHAAGRVSPKVSTGERLAVVTGQPEKVCWAAVERAIRHGFLEHGVSLRSSYPTEKGKALLLSQTGWNSAQRG